ncbi:MAG: glycine--tRNA ligase [Candidatus Heimdallarchaeaceae archaeon]
MSEEKLMDKIIDVSLRRGFVNPTAEIYGGVGGFFEYGPLGTLMKQKIIDLWRQIFVLDEDRVFEISGSVLLPETVFKASGHLDSFEDPLVQCEKCKSMFRADEIIKQTIGESAEGLAIEELDKIIGDNNITCSTCGGKLSKARQFNLMFKTQVGSTGGVNAYLRPETAQNIFINFKRLAGFMRNKLPFGVAQVGHSFRNEISPRNFLLRVREFEQMEIEMFYDPEKENEHPRFEEVADVELNLVTKEMQEKGWEKPVKISAEQAVKENLIPNQYMAYYLAMESEMLKALGIPEDEFWFRHMRTHEAPHYSAGNFDLEVELSIGIMEIVGNALRTDYDLKKHAKAAKTSYEIVVEQGRKILPHVVEPSLGVGRILYSILEKCYRDDGRGWSWFQFPSVVAPLEVAVFPLMKKDGLAEIAYDIHEDLKDAGYLSFYDESGKIGKRYARADEIGIPYCITIDYETKKEDSVTIRDRDTMKQIRIPLEDLEVVLGELMEGDASFDEFEEIK